MSWIASAAGAVTIDTLASGIDTLLSVYTNAPGQPVALANLVKVAENDDAPGLRVLQSQVQFTNLIAGQEYFITIDGYNGVGGIVAAHVVLTSFAPVITTQPVGQTNNLGSSAAFTVAASGPGTLGYQWRFNGASLAGQTNTTLSLADLKGADSGSYDALVTSEYGATASQPAVLLVRVAPVVVAGPQSRAVLAGASVQFSVTATGGTLSYQWRFNEANIPGATGSSYTLNNVRANQAGTYSVLVTNAMGSAVGGPAELTVLSALERPLLSAPVWTNGAARFSVTGVSASYKCYVHVTTNLVTWTTVSIITNLNGTAPVTDSQAASGHRFYRAYLAP